MNVFKTQNTETINSTAIDQKIRELLAARIIGAKEDVQALVQEYIRVSTKLHSSIDDKTPDYGTSHIDQWSREIISITNAMDKAKHSLYLLERSLAEVDQRLAGH